MYNFKRAKHLWSAPPIDGVGYIKSLAVADMDKESILKIVSAFEAVRYDSDQPRNYKNLWRKNLGLDSTKNKTIIDFGCGFGIESLQFCKSGNSVILADISENNLLAAEAVLNAFGYKPKDIVLVNGEEPFFTSCKYDIFYSNGVLHHTPQMFNILNHSLKYFNSIEEAEIRLLLYTDKSWTVKTEKSIDYDTPIEKQDGFDIFVKAMDGVGQYADWYDRKKLEALLPDVFKVNDFSYICGGPLKDLYATINISLNKNV